MFLYNIFIIFSEIQFICQQKKSKIDTSTEANFLMSYEPEMHTSVLPNSEKGSLIQSLNTSQLRVQNEGYFCNIKSVVKVKYS